MGRNGGKGEMNIIRENSPPKRYVTKDKETCYA